MTDVQVELLRRIVAGEPVSEAEHLVVDGLRRLGFVYGPMKALKATPVGEEALRRHKDQPTMWLSEESKRLAAEYAAAVGWDTHTALNGIVDLFVRGRVWDARRYVAETRNIAPSNQNLALAAIRLPGETP